MEQSVQVSAELSLVLLSWAPHLFDQTECATSSRPCHAPLEPFQFPLPAYSHQPLAGKAPRASRERSSDWGADLGVGARR